jgi:hypothetical protein
VASPIKRSIFYNTFFWSKLTESARDKDGKVEDYNYANVERWTRKMMVSNMLETEMIVVPINHGNTHWALATLWPATKAICYMDSLGTEKHGKRVTTTLLRWLKEDVRNTTKRTVTVDISEWTVRPQPDNLPPQTNGCDCGGFALLYTLYTYLGLEEHMPFTEAQISLLRRFFAHCILSKSLALIESITATARCAVVQGRRQSPPTSVSFSASSGTLHDVIAAHNGGSVSPPISVSSGDSEPVDRSIGHSDRRLSPPISVSSGDSEPVDRFTSALHDERDTPHPHSSRVPEENGSTNSPTLQRFRSMETSDVCCTLAQHSNTPPPLPDDDRYYTEQSEAEVSFSYDSESASSPAPESVNPNLDTHSHSAAPQESPGDGTSIHNDSKRVRETKSSDASRQGHVQRGNAAKRPRMDSPLTDNLDEGDGAGGGLDVYTAVAVPSSTVAPSLQVCTTPVRRGRDKLRNELSAVLSRIQAPKHGLAQFAKSKGDLAELKAAIRNLPALTPDVESVYAHSVQNRMHPTIKKRLVDLLESYGHLRGANHLIASAFDVATATVSHYWTKIQSAIPPSSDDVLVMADLHRLMSTLVSPEPDDSRVLLPSTFSSASITRKSRRTVPATVFRDVLWPPETEEPQSCSVFKQLPVPVTLTRFGSQCVVPLAANALVEGTSITVLFDPSAQNWGAAPDSFIAISVQGLLEWLFRDFRTHMCDSDARRCVQPSAALNTYCVCMGRIDIPMLSNISSTIIFLLHYPSLGEPGGGGVYVLLPSNISRPDHEQAYCLTRRLLDSWRKEQQKQKLPLRIKLATPLMPHVDVTFTPMFHPQVVGAGAKGKVEERLEAYVQACGAAEHSPSFIPRFSQPTDNSSRTPKQRRETEAQREEELLQQYFDAIEVPYHSTTNAGSQLIATTDAPGALHAESVLADQAQARKDDHAQDTATDGGVHGTNGFDKIKPREENSVLSHMWNSAVIAVAGHREPIRETSPIVLGRPARDCIGPIVTEGCVAVFENDSKTVEGTGGQKRKRTGEGVEESEND